MNFEDLMPELREKIRACGTPEEVLALAKAEGVELTDEQLDQVAGGQGWFNQYYVTCSKCGCTIYDYEYDVPNTCPNCGSVYTVER